MRTVTLADPRVAQPSLQRSYLVPSVATAKPGEAEALEVLSHILGSGSNSRLYTSLVMQKQLAVSASAWYQSASLDDSRFGVSGTPRPNVTLPQLDDAIDGVIAELVEKGVTADELDRAKSRLVAETIYAQDNQATLARWFGGGLTTGSTVQDILAWPDRLKAVTSDQVREAAKKWLDKRRSVTGFLVKEIARPEEKRS